MLIQCVSISVLNHWSLVHTQSGQQCAAILKYDNSKEGNNWTYFFTRSLVRIRRASELLLIDIDLPKLPGAVAGELRTGLFTLVSSLAYGRRIWLCCIWERVGEVESGNSIATRMGFANRSEECEGNVQSSYAVYRRLQCVAPHVLSRSRCGGFRPRKVLAAETVCKKLHAWSTNWAGGVSTFPRIWSLHFAVIRGALYHKRLQLSKGCTNSNVGNMAWRVRFCRAQMQCSARRFWTRHAFWWMLNFQW